VSREMYIWILYLINNYLLNVKNCIVLEQTPITTH
jgi:hypothetical protein